jgi:SAM-dependent methyltransferase
MSLVCRVCLSQGQHARYTVREQMFGWGDEFNYFRCADCGCLQIERVPEDLGRFYPRNYYSFNLAAAPQQGLKSRLAGLRDSSAATGSGVLGGLLSHWKQASLDVRSLGGIPARKDMRILDVGCGRGELLSVLHRAGVGQLEGVDPYLSADVEVLPGLRVSKKELDQVTGEYDLIMLHHVFEHLEFGGQLLKAGRQKLAKNGKILLRFPTPESEAWDRYGENWVQWDAPRHLFLHTRKSVGILAEQAGLKIEKCWCDSCAFQFWGSELYKRGLSFDKNGTPEELSKHFTDEQMKAFDQEAEKLNASDRGDQLVVILGAQN